MAEPPEIVEPSGAEPEPDCRSCQHSNDDHVLVATGETPLQGGIRLCPVKWCTCWATWSPPWVPAEEVTVFDLETTEQLRAHVQGLD